MKNKWLSFVLALVMVLSTLLLCGCELVEVNAEKDLNSVVAVVCGEEITKRMVMNQWDRQKASMGVTDEYELSEDGEEIIAYVLENLLQDMTKTVIRRHTAQDLGLYPLCEEAREKMVAYADEMYDQRVAEAEEALTSSLAMENASDEDYFEAAKSSVATQMEGQFAFSREMDLREAEDMVITELLRDYYGRDITADDSDVAAYYDSLLAEQQETYAEDTNNFTKALGEETVILYQPGSTVRVKQVLVGFDESVQAQIAAYRKANKTNKADELLQSSAAELLETAQEVVQRAKDGEEFDDLIVEFGTDTGMMTNAKRQEGYLVSRDSTDYVEEFKEAALALENAGDISEPILTDYGYHIIYAIDVYEEKTVELDEVREELLAQLLEQDRSAAYVAALETAYQETPVEYYTKRLLRGNTNTIGVDAAALTEEKRLDV